MTHHRLLAVLITLLFNIYVMSVVIMYRDWLIIVSVSCIGIAANCTLILDLLYTLWGNKKNVGRKPNT